MLHLPPEVLSCVFGHLQIDSLHRLNQVCQLACQQVRQLPWYNSEAGQPVRSQKLRLWQHQVKRYLQCARHPGRVFSSFHTLKYHARTAAGVPALLQAVQTFCSTAARDDPRGLTVSIKGYAVQDLKRDAAVAYATQLLDILATRPDLHTLRVTLPANTACITALADLPGLRHLTLHWFYPCPKTGGVDDPATDLSFSAKQELVGAVLAATRQVTHLTLGDQGGWAGGVVAIPHQLQQCTQLQALHCRCMPLVVCEPEHWAYLAGAKQLRDIMPRVTIRQPPPPGTSLSLDHVTEAQLKPGSMTDLGLMLAGLPGLRATRVRLDDEYTDTARSADQVFVSKTLRELDVDFWVPQAVELSFCEALLAGRFPQLQDLKLRFGFPQWPRAVKQGLPGFPQLTKLLIRTEGGGPGDLAMDALQPLITSGQYVEDLQLIMTLDTPVPHNMLLDVIRDMPRLTRLRYNYKVVGDGRALLVAVTAVNPLLKLVNVAYEGPALLGQEELDEDSLGYRNRRRQQRQQQDGSSSGEVDEYEDWEEWDFSEYEEEDASYEEDDEYEEEEPGRE